MTASGTTARVIFCAPGSLRTNIESIQMEGTFDGKNLAGHLINETGLVTADYKVQVFYEAERIHPSVMFDGNANAASARPKVGSAAYNAKHKSAALDKFLADPGAWPEGFEPILKPLVNIPISAHGFLTQAEAEELAESQDIVNSPSVGTQLVLATFRYMRSGGDKNVTYIFDPNNLLPNAYAFVREQQRFVVVTAGLARVKGLYWQGMSVIVSTRSYFEEGIETCRPSRLLCGVGRPSHGVV